MPTKTHQKYLGNSNEPKDDRKLLNPITVNNSPNPEMLRPSTRKMSLEVECFGSIFSVMELIPRWVH
jgi:hypothetical protein